MSPLPLVILILLPARMLSFSQQAETRYPCAFIDTVDSLNSTKGVFVYKGMTIPNDLVASYDFVIENGVRVPAERHLRACVCKLKPCVRFCCPPGQMYDLQSRNCHEVSDSLPPAPNQTHLQVELLNGTLVQVETEEQFSVHVGTPCNHMRAITKGAEYVHWTLHENGTVTHRGHLFSKHYCFTPLMLRASSSSWDWQPLACTPEKLHFVLGVREWTYAVCLFISIISMFIVLIVHLLCTEMRNTFYGVAIKAYTICIIVGYSLLGHLTLNDPANLSKSGCRLIPCFTLLSLVLSFYILSFISFNLYLNFHNVILTKLMFWLILGPIVLIAVGWSVFVGFSYQGAKLVFGGDTCWFDPRNWSVMVYLFAPIFIACAICGFFYILTLIRISECDELETEKNFESLQENRFKSFWKFFGYTALTWFVCVCSFAINYYRDERSHHNYAVCFFMAFHGFAALYALIGKNQQIQNFLRRIEDNVDEDACENSVPMRSY
ncbi:probable G-protein coupled receptor Mth-like 8 [Scaptodrosophila lebanonensis]|uniref:Probable G-protein coupled receptor Mth-like 8 n=1 Tax=Drosophila lebanonensis TaxID=7225 RepID=A0A6J2TKK0_DROLE|nr:probable G-protein coupled receptor Mth-like 8 [Scaptodrosophila lebanonensis]